MSITSNCMVANLKIGAWQGYRLDREASRAVTESNNASADAARVNKHLVPKEALKDIIAAQGAVRTHFYTKTLPWKDNGDRLLTRKVYMSFMNEHARLADKFNDAVTHFVTVGYPKAIQQAEFRMGDLFSRDDYPSAQQLTHKFYIAMDVDAVVEAGDFRVALDDTELERVRASMEVAMQDRINRSMRDVWGRLSDTLGHFATKMGSDGVFRNSTVSNLEDVVGLLPSLNVTDDPDLARILQTVEDTVLGHTPKELRDDVDLRSAAAQEAATIVHEMRGFMTAFGSGEG
jgi:hypothetical protein